MNPSANNYQAWTIRAQDYPSSGTDQEQIEFVLQYGLLAPSTHNTQPWVFKQLQPLEFQMSPDWSRELPFSDSSGRGMFISLGCCLFNILVAGNYFGWVVGYELQGSSRHASRLTLTFTRETKTRQSISGLGLLLPGITQRWSNKVPFRHGAIPVETLKSLRNISYEGARVVVTNDTESIKQLAQLHHSSTLGFSTNHKFSQEVSRWMRPSNTRRFDGMPGFTFGLPAPAALIAKFVTHLTPAAVKVVAKKDFTSLSRAAAVGMITVGHEAPQDWINAGLAYQHVGVAIAVQGIYLAPKSATIEAGHGQQLVQIFKGEGLPQLYFGAGYGDGTVRHSPRRRLAQVLISEGLVT
jgi:hypothetical protein